MIVPEGRQEITSKTSYIGTVTTDTSEQGSFFIVEYEIEDHDGKKITEPVVLSAQHCWFSGDNNHEKFEYCATATLRLGVGSEDEIKFQLSPRDILLAVKNMDDALKSPNERKYYRDIVLSKLPKVDVKGRDLKELVRQYMAKNSMKEKMRTPKLEKYKHDLWTEYKAETNLYPETTDMGDIHNTAPAMLQRQEFI